MYEVKTTKDNFTKEDTRNAFVLAKAIAKYVVESRSLLLKDVCVDIVNDKFLKRKLVFIGYMDKHLLLPPYASHEEEDIKAYLITLFNMA